MSNGITKFYNTHPTFKAAINSIIVLLVASGILIGCLNGLHIGLKLWGISTEISYINELRAPDEDDIAYYNELQGERVIIRDSSFLGYLMVQAGAHFSSSLVRFCYLVFIWPVGIVVTIWLSFQLIWGEWQRYIKNIERAKMSPQQLAKIYELRAERLAAKVTMLRQTAMDYRQKAEEENSRQVTQIQQIHNKQDVNSQRILPRVYTGRR